MTTEKTQYVEKTSSNNSKTAGVTVGVASAVMAVGAIYCAAQLVQARYHYEDNQGHVVYEDHNGLAGTDYYWVDEQGNYHQVPSGSVHQVNENWQAECEGELATGFVCLGMGAGALPMGYVMLKE